MKTLFIFRDDFESQWLLSDLLKKVPNTSVILETGSVAKKKKLVRTFKKSSPIMWPVKVLDLVSLQIYGLLWENYFKKHTKQVKKVQGFVVSDVNEENCILEIKRINPDVIVIFGTAIIKEQFFQRLKVPIFNIHTGILPKYRNVHSEFWAYKNRDFENIGTTIIHLDPGIDSGAIALQEKVVYEKGDMLFLLKLKNLKLVTLMVVKLLKLHRNKKVPKVRQRNSEAGFYKTPTTIDLLANLLKIF